MFQPLSTLALLVAFSFTAWSQESADPRSAVEAWRELQGPTWQARFDPRTGWVSSLYGGRTRGSLPLFDEAQARARAREHLAAARALTGLELGTLVDDRVLFLPLSHAGSSDKYTVRLRQAVRGVPVVGASVNVLMDLEGRALSIESSAIPQAEQASTTPLREAGAAVAQALAQFASLAGTPGTLEGAPRLVLDADPLNHAAVLAWEVDVFGEGEAGVPRGLRLRLADSDLRLCSREELVHTCDVSGTVYTRLTPGMLPDIAGNPPLQQALAHVEVRSAQGHAITDANGHFTIVGASAPLPVNLGFDGPFTTPINAQGPAYTLATTLASAAGNVLVMNSPALAGFTAEANSMNWIGRLRDWTRQVNPADATADFDALSVVNLAQSCNAYWNGSSVNFFSAAGNCVNTAYSTVVLHEMGHWLNGRYASGNGGDGFGEGNADNFATFVTDQPIVGENFVLGGSYIRSGLNTRMFCGDSAPGCYGEVHADGEVLMGALWKVRTRLKNSLGASAGAAAADVLFNSWMNAYDDSKIQTLVRTHWLVLDDDDGNIDNGTPNYAAIDLGFGDQGFPLYQRAAISIAGLTQLANTLDENGPYAVSAKVTANLAPPLQPPQLFWRVNSGPFNALTMSAMGGDLWQAAIPGQLSPAKIEYYVRGVDALGAQGFAPAGAPATLQRFSVGEERLYYSDLFAGLSSNWSGGAASGSNDWQFQPPVGKAGDPSAARSGLRCWGNDQGTGPSDGFYPPNTSSWLQSPPIDLSACAYPRLRLQRWLTIESAQHDIARIKVNGQLLWQNGAGADLIDQGWTEMEFDIASIAAGDPSTIVRFELSSDGQVQKGGWNVDDVQILSLAAVGQGCTDPVPYCTAKLTSIGTIPKLRSMGSTSLGLSNLVLVLRDAAQNKAGVVFHSSSGPNASPFAGGTLCVLPPIVRDSPFTTDMFGYVEIPLPFSPASLGQTWYVQTWFRDPPASSGSGLSDALRLQICP